MSECVTVYICVFVCMSMWPVWFGVCVCACVQLGLGLWLTEAWPLLWDMLAEGRSYCSPLTVAIAPVMCVPVGACESQGAWPDVLV